MLSVKEIFGDNKEKIVSYLKSISSESGRIHLNLHRRNIELQDPSALILTEIENKYGIGIITVRDILKKSVESVSTHCPVCGKEIDLHTHLKYTCGNKKCAARNPDRAEKRKKTNLERYGVECTFQAESVKEKIKESILEHYGVEYSWQAKEVQEKIKKTNLERYGHESAMQNKDIYNKARNTVRKRYGVDHQMHLESVKNKIKQTCIKKYGVENPYQSEEIKAKIRGTLFERYGAEYVTQVKELKEKIKQVCLEKYGVPYTLQVKEIRDMCRQTFCEKYREQHYEEFLDMLTRADIEMLTSYEDHLSAEYISFKCKQCGNIFEHQYNSAMSHMILCPVCNPDDKMETSVASFMKELLGEDKVFRHNRKILEGNRELDVYIPDKNLAIEFDGVFWHQADRVGQAYHVGKTDECEAKGIRLMHILENEWMYKREIVKSILMAKVGIFDRTAYARNCSVVELSNEDYFKFLIDNHIQGALPSKIKLGLTYNGELLSVAGISKSRFKEGENELIRFCSKLGTKVIGALSKLITHSGVKDLVSYVDRRYFDGSGYAASGFELIEKTQPSYIYANGASGEILSRYQCQKHKLPELLGDLYDPNMTEEENMLLAGYFKIYDCGTLKYRWHRS